jgi:hypothetical protein
MGRLSTSHVVLAVLGSWLAACSSATTTEVVVVVAGVLAQEGNKTESAQAEQGRGKRGDVETAAQIHHFTDIPRHGAPLQPSHDLNEVS